MRFDFPNASGDTLSGKLELPLDEPRAFALFAHCFTCSKDVIAAHAIAKALASAGIGVLRFDFTGLGNSQGDFSNTNFSSNVDDLHSACSHLAKKYAMPELLIGHSLGGAAVLKAAVDIEEVKAVVTIAAPSELSHLSDLLVSKNQTIEREGQARVNLAGRTFTVKKQLLEDLQKTELLEGVEGFRKALLVMHAPLDDTVSIEHAGRIFQAARHPKSFVSLDSADHLLTNDRDGHYAARVIAAWADRYLTPAGRENETIPKKTVVVRSRQQTRFTQDVFTADHHVLADEPRRLKGNNLGMNPYEFVLAGLGACTSMTLRMYADRKDIPLAGVEVRLQHDRVHADDCEHCQSTSGKIDRIRKSIHLSGDLSDDQKNRLYEIAEKCPVNKTLQSETFMERKDQLDLDEE
ncbi:MAG TPA: bifunctional alpha/beta hydrolase/OsmC family protein [Desulfopila sp.]|nr:bifunctional alpha/beta hydrolase/OsmC family protein [Desulfopila sp.]